MSSSGAARYPHWPLWQTYFQGFVGRFGWFDFGFPTLGQRRRARRARCRLAAMAVRASQSSRAVCEGAGSSWPTYALLVVSASSASIAVAGYRYRIQTGQNFEQTRYLFPLLPLYGALVALAMRGVGRRWEAIAAIVLVMLALGHDIFSQLLTIGHYYT